MINKVELMLRQNAVKKSEFEVNISEERLYACLLFHKDHVVRS